MYQIDLNSDLGESFGRYTIGNDDKIIPLITSANVALLSQFNSSSLINIAIQYKGFV